MVKKFNLIRMFLFLISFFLIFIYSNKLFSFEGTAKIIVKKASVYDLRDNLLIDLNKNDTVCICNKKNKSWSNSYFSVCDEFNKLKGVIARNYVGGLTKKSCSAIFTKSNTIVTSKKLNSNIIEDKDLTSIGRVVDISSGNILIQTYARLNKKSKLIINNEIVYYSKKKSRLYWPESANGDLHVFLKSKKFKTDVELSRKFKKGDLVYIQNIKIAKNNNDSKIITIKKIKSQKKLELRKGQETYSYPIHFIPKGVYVNIIDQNDTYYKVKYLNKIGFIQKKDLQTDQVKEKIKTADIKKINKQKSKQEIKIKKDFEGPNISVANTFEANNDLTASIQGQITDQSDIVSLMIDGDEVSMVNGSFNKELYVFPRGQEVEIIARDKHGNKSETTVKLVRATVVAQEEKFDFLDPRKIKAKTNKNAVAIIIGIEDYENTFAAPFATNDAVTFNDFARLSLGIPANNIKLLTNDEAERNDTLKVLRTWLPKKIEDNQTELYVFYSGHGLASEDGNDLYLLPADGEPDILEDTTILRNKMFDIIAELNPKRVTMFFDTCYSGATRDEEFLVAAKPIFIEAAEQDIPTNFNIFSASSGRETAKVLKEAEHGLFSYYMMKGLEGEADKNNDQQITNGELITFINKNVSRQADQTPQLNGNPDQVLVQW